MAEVNKACLAGKYVRDETMITSNFVIWKAKDEPHACVLKDLHNVPDLWELSDGVSRVTGFPTDAYFDMDPDYPHDTLLVDNLANTDRVIVASSKLVTILQHFHVSPVEYLPVAIEDHRGKTAASYTIVHLIEPVDCIDNAKSVLRWDSIDTDAIARVKKLVIDEAKIPVGRLLFRPKHLSQVTLVHRELAEAISREGCTGVRWIEINDYPE
jgi:hypothetical protein